MKSSDNRCGPLLNYIISSVLEFFGKDSLNNIFAMCTFASLNDPECLDILKREKLNKYFKYDNQAIFPKESHSRT